MTSSLAPSRPTERHWKERLEQQPLGAILRGETSDQLAQQLRAWQLGPTARRLMRAAEQARGVATRLHKPALPDQRRGSPEGHLTSCTRVDDDEVVISIADDGRGIDWQAIARASQMHQLRRAS